MKHLLFFLAFFLLPIGQFAQSVEDLTFVSPLRDGFISVQKDNQWGFLDSTGVLVVDFRGDLVNNEDPTSKTEMGVASMQYPILSNGRSVIRKEEKGVAYYGFIDVTGAVVIEPRFLNVSAFKNDHALALQIEEQFLGRNDLLGLKVKTYRYDVVLIDKSGEIKTFLAGPFTVAISKEKLRTAPPIEAKWMGKNLIAVRNPDKKWKVEKISPLF